MNIKRLLLITIIVISSLGLIWQVASYSQVKLKNSANIAVTFPEDSLIAILDVIDVEVTQQKTVLREVNETFEDNGDTTVLVNSTVTKSIVHENEFISNVDGTMVTNNMASEISIASTNATVNGVNLSTKEVKNLKSGERANIPIDVRVPKFNVDPNSVTGNFQIVNSESIPLIFFVTWNGGNAEIQSTAYVDIVQEVKYDSSYSSWVIKIDKPKEEISEDILKTPEAFEAPEAPETTENDKNGEEENPQDGSQGVKESVNGNEDGNHGNTP